MSIFKYIKELDKKFSWSFSGFILAIIFGALAVYTSFFHEKKPHLSFEVLNNTAVLDVHEQLGKLDILYDGNRIKEKGQTLCVITVRIINDGQADILKNYYDDNDPLGFYLVGGNIVEKPEILQSSNEYLTNTMKPELKDTHTLLFSNVILEANEFYTVKILALHDEASIPDISPFGKVAGIKSIAVTRPYQNKDEGSFWTRVFSGNILTQLIRLFSYTIGTFVTILLFAFGIILPISSFKDWLDKRKRRKLVNEYKLLSDEKFTREDDFIFQSYINSGYSYLYRTSSYLSKPDKLEKLVLDLKKNPDNKFYEIVVDEHGERRVKGLQKHLISKDLIDTNFIHINENGIVINNHMKKTFDDLIKFLQSRGKTSPRFMEKEYEMDPGE